MNIRNTDNPTIAYLIRGYFIPLEITAKVEQIDLLKAAGVVEADTRILNLQADIEALGKQFSEIKRQISEFSNDVRLVRTLELRYINGLPIKEIAKRMMYCNDYAQRLLTRATKAFKEHLAQTGIKLE